MKMWTKTLATAALLAGGSVAQACTIGAWTTGVGLTDADANGASYQGLCGLSVASSANGTIVRDESPGNEPSYIARFFVDARNAAITNGTGVSILKAYTGAVPGTEVFDVSLVGAASGRPNVVVTPAGGSATAPYQLPDNTNWNSIEVRWAAGTPGSMEVVVNGYGPGITPVAVTSSVGVDYVEFGSAGTGDAGSGGSFLLDEFESRRTTDIGLPLTGDTNLDGAISVNDLITILSNALNPVNGPADCDGNGVLSVNDLICVLQAAA